MNVLLTSLETLAPGGVNTVVEELGKHLSKKGHTVTVLQGNQLKLASEEIYEGFKIVRISSPLEKHLHSLNGKLYFYLKKHLKELDPQVVHLHGHIFTTPEVFYAVRKIDRSIPTVVNFHVDAWSGDTQRKLFWNLYTKIDKNVAKKATHIVADSNFEADYVRKTFCVRDNKVSTINLGIDPVFRQSSKHRKSRRKDEIRLLSVGYLIKRKNFESVLYILHELVHGLGTKGAHLTIIGLGPEKANLLRLADELQIDDHITWKELMSEAELVNAFLEADVFLLLSRSEAYGIVVAEALSIGIPCIVADTTALREFTNEPGCFGVDSPPDPRTVAKLVLRILENDVQVGPLSDKIRTWERVTQDYEEVYEYVVRRGTYRHAEN
jgi:glycosyltransferase involved in cell wall biosynthesis